MLIRKDAPKKEIRALKRGDFFIDGEIVSIHKTDRIISIITSADNLYNAHMKNGTYTVFLINRHKRMLKI
jgi:hypothetical protein